MAVISQKDRPIGLVVIDSAGLSIGGFDLPIGIPTFYLFSPRPENLSYTHPSRGSVIQTFDGGFVDDFGEGLADITASGTTGWNGDLLPGELKFYALRDLVVLGFHEMRAMKAAAGLPIESVKMYWVDTLNLFVYEVYPISFVGSRTAKPGPLLYKYSLRLTGIKRDFGISNLLGKGLGMLA